MKFITLFLALILIASALPVAEAALVVNKYTNDFTLSSPNNEQLKVCSCSTKTDLLIIENVGNFDANYHLEILSPKKDWMTLSQEDFTLPPKSRKEILNYVETPCGEIGVYDYSVKVTSSYGREEILHRTLRADVCQNIDLRVQPIETTSNLCQPVDYDVFVKNVGTYPETYELSFGSYEEYMNYTLKEFYLKPGQSYEQIATLTLPCTFYGEYKIPFTAFSSKNNIEDTQTVTLNVENQFDHTIDVPTELQVCSRVTEQIPFTITNEIDVDNKYNINIKGPGFVDVENNQRTLELKGEESETLYLEAKAQEGQEGDYTLTLEVTDSFGKVTKERNVELAVRNCYDFAIELRNQAQEAITQDTRCCGLETYNLNIRNNGQTRETYNLLNEGPSWFVPEELSVTLNPGESRNIRIFAEAPCADATHSIPLTVYNDRFEEVREGVVFTINSQTQRSCHFVAIDDDEFEITKDATFTPVIVKHNGTEGGIYDITIDSEIYTLVEDQIEIYPGERKLIHLETTNLSPLEFGRYITQPTFTYSEANNPLATVDGAIDYVEHLGVELNDHTLLYKAWDWIANNWWLPGLCGWIGILFLIFLLIVLIVYLLGVRFETTNAAGLRVLLLVGMLIVFTLLAVVQLPGEEAVYELPENKSDYFVTIYQNDKAELNLDEYFVDPDMDALSYTATQPGNLAITIEENIMTIKPEYGFTGEQELVVTAQDNKGGYEDSPVLDIYVIPRKDMGFLGWWQTYCVQINLILLLLILLFLLLMVVEKKEKTEKKRSTVVYTMPRNNKITKKPVKPVSVVKTAKKTTKTMSLAQREKISKALDKNLVSSEDHEMKQVLATHKKRQTQENIEKLQEALKKFKADKRFKPNNREKFYQYLESMKVLDTLEGLQKKPVSVAKTAKKTTKTMSLAQREKISKALDKNLVSSEDHEMKQVLATHKKRQTQENIEKLQEALKKFKADKRFKPNNREKFYQYLESMKVLDTLEGLQTKPAKAVAPTRTAAQMDRNRVSSEDHEMKQVLRTHGKRETKRNVELLRTYLKEFKSTKMTRNRANFYRFLKEQDKLRVLHNR